MFLKSKLKKKRLKKSFFLIKKISNIFQKKNHKKKYQNISKTYQNFHTQKTQKIQKI